MLTSPATDEAVESLPLAPPIDPPRRIMQQITADWGGHQETFVCVLELDKRRIAVAGLSSNGMSLFNINYDGHKVNKTKSPLLPEAVKPEHIIHDIQLAFWPVSALQTVLPANWRLVSDSAKRDYFVNDELSVKVEYKRDALPTQAIWPKSAVLTNHRYHYRLNINTISDEALPE